MPIEITDCDGGLGNLIVCTGIITDEECIETYHKHLTQEKDKFKKYKYSLIDHTAATEIQISNDTILQVAELSGEASIVNPGAIVAHIANQDIMFGLARMWEVLTDVTPWETMVFRTKEEAMDWIRETIRNKFGLDDLTFR